MSELTQLNADNHRHLHIAKCYTGMPLFHENTFPALLCELPLLQREYPIVVLKSGETGALSLHVLTALNEHENLFITNGTWIAQTIPLFVSRHPFSLQLSNTSTATLLVDTSHPAFIEEEGLPLFTQDGLPSPFTTNIQNQLGQAYRSQTETQAFLDFVDRHNLLSTLSIKYIDAKGVPQRRDGMLVPSLEKLITLDNTIVNEAVMTGFYNAMVLIEASLGAMQQLIKQDLDKQVLGRHNTEKKDI